MKDKRDAAHLASPSNTATDAGDQSTARPGFLAELQILKSPYGDGRDGRDGGDGDDLAAQLARASSKAKLFGVLEPVRLDRYAIVEVLGAGAMGEVYAAYDPELARTVAIKVIKPSAWGDSERARSALVREAQAMAQLAHPNTVNVYEVNAEGNRLYVVMEHVDGGTLTDWLAAEYRSQADILERFLAAGEGLAAAHEKKLIHRDFKPDNVLIGRDGRVRVSDFGLVGTSGVEMDVAALAAAGTETIELTKSTAIAGEIKGTPRYMAPEQHQGQKVDARADIFGFCVALYEALYGELPFAGQTYADLAANVCAGHIAESRRRSATGEPQRRVPGWLRAVLARGLRADADERYASMGELLAALRADPAVVRRRRVRTGAVLIALALAAAAIVFGLTREAELPPFCQSSRGKLAEKRLWNDEVRGAMLSAFAAVGMDAAYASLARNLDDHAERWVRWRDQTCQQGWGGKREEQVRKAADRRLACLDKHLDDWQSLRDTLTNTVTEETARYSERAVRYLSNNLDECMDPSLPPPPPEEHERAAVAELEMAEFMARTREAVGQNQTALTTVDDALAKAESIQYPAIRAKLLITRAGLLDRLGHKEQAIESLKQAVFHADSGSDDKTRVRAMGGIVYMLASNFIRLDEAQRWLEQLQATLKRFPDSLALQAKGVGYEGDLYFGLGRYEKAEAAYRQSQALFEELGKSVDDLRYIKDDIALLDYNIGILHDNRSNPAAALVHYKKALGGFLTAGRGGSVPASMALAQMADCYEDLGQFDMALDHYRRALKMRIAIIGRNVPAIADLYLAISSVYNERGDFDRVEQALRQAEEIYDQSASTLPAQKADLYTRWGNFYKRSKQDFKSAHKYFQLSREFRNPNDAPGIATDEWNLADNARNQGLWQEALDGFQRLLELQTKAYGPEHSELADAHEGLGLTHLGMINARVKGGDAQAAQRHCAKALELTRASQPEGSPHLIFPLSCLGDAHSALKEHDQALQQWEQAYAIITSRELLPYNEADMRLMYAQALRRARGASALAQIRPLLEQAIAGFESVGSDAARERAKLARAMLQEMTTSARVRK